MPENGVKLDVLHKMFGPDDHAQGNSGNKTPALSKKKLAGGKKGAAGDKLTLIDAIQADGDVEQGDDSKVRESVEVRKADAMVDGDIEERKSKPKPGFFAKVGTFVKRELYSKPVAFWARSKNALIVTLGMTCLCLVAAVVALSIVTVNGEFPFSTRPGSAILPALLLPLKQS